MKFPYKLFVLFFLASSIFSQYQIQSPYLQYPSKSIGYVDSCAKFWLSAYDNAKGGFYTNIDKYGNVITSWGTNKNMITQSRDAYGYVRAFMMTGDTNYLNMARKGLGFLYAYGWDNSFGGWFDVLSENGDPTNPNANKTAFNQHYGILGTAAFYEATRDTFHFNWLMKGYDHLENYFWDERTDYLGYYDYTDYNNINPQCKSFNATVDAITTNLLLLYLLTNEQKYFDRLVQLSEQIKQYLVESMDSQAIGFVEKFDSDWNWNTSETMTLMGHVLKAAWCLARVYQLNPDTSYVIAAEKLAKDVWNKGYDHDMGGPYKDYDRVTGEMLMWGNPDTAKAWWQMEQAVMAGLQLFNITGDSIYLQMADESLNFFMKYFVDHEYGEVYENRTKYGLETWGEHKGTGSKAAYHSIELGYYVYLYGNLIIQNDTAKLFYYFTPIDSNREIFLNPIALETNKYKIRNIFKDGIEYYNFNSEDRILSLSSGVGGLFKVIFEPTEPQTFIAGNDKIIPEKFLLYQNYPNPFNPSTTIKFDLAENSNVSMIIYNILGEEIRTLVNGYQTAGQKYITWDGKDNIENSISSGLYICVINANNYVKSIKMIMMK
ncbi:MAG: AGE family epimerase/isomerase [Ignavibacteriales bacterium]|nr:AGE family epimerase/isomerase [Ignavibacteriales bacterium]